MSKEVTGNIVDLCMEGKFNVMLHACPFDHSVHKGIGLDVKIRLPQAHEADKETLNAESKLGTYSVAKIDNGDNSFLVINAYILKPTEKGEQIDLHATKALMTKLAKDLPLASKIAYPMLGASLSGDTWDKVKPIMNKSLKSFNHTLVLR